MNNCKINSFKIIPKVISRVEASTNESEREGGITLRFAYRSVYVAHMQQIHRAYFQKYLYIWVSKVHKRSKGDFPNNPHCVKSVQIRSYFWSVFSRIRTEYGEYSVSLHIQSECGKIRTKNNSIFGHFSHSAKIIPEVGLTQRWKNVARDVGTFWLNAVTMLAPRCHKLPTRILYNVLTTLSNEFGGTFIS